MIHGHYRHPKKPTLKKTLSLFEVTMFGVGLILGAGIYVLIGRGAGLAGNALWLSFLVGAVIATLTGLSYCELSSRFPRESAEYMYSKKAFNKNSLSFIIGWILIFAGSVSASAVALGFGEYFAKLLSWELTTVPLIAGMLLVLLSFVNFWGIKESARLNILFTIIEMLGLFIIIAIGIPFLGSVDYLATPVGFAFENFAPIMSAAALIFFAYIGFGEMPKIIEETKEGYKTIPKALIYSIIISTALYILVAVSAVSIIPWYELKEAPLTTIVEGIFGMSGGMLMSVIALFATFNTVLAILVGFSRLLYGMADMHGLPSALSKIHQTRRTPHYAILAILLLSLFFLLLGDISVLASVTDLGIFIMYFVVNGSLIILRYKDYKSKAKPVHRFRCPLNIGWFPLTAFFGFITVIMLVLHFEPIIYLYEAGIILIGFVLYCMLKKLRRV